MNPPTAKPTRGHLPPVAVMISRPLFSLRWTIADRIHAVGDLRKK